MPDDSAAPEPSPFAKAGELFSQVGNRGLYRNSGYNHGEYQHNLRSGPQANRVWAEMVNDPTVYATLSSVEMLLKSVTWNVEAQTTDAEDIARAEFIEECMRDLDWDDVVADALSMLPFGFSVVETVYKRRLGPAQKDPSKRSDYNDGKIGWGKLVLIPQDTIVDWEIDDHGEILGAVQQTGMGGRTLIPAQKSLIFRTVKRNPWGRSVLRASYTPWYQKKKIEEIEGIWIERDLCGYPVAEVDAATLAANPAIGEEWKNILRNTRVDEQMGVLIPQAYDENGNPAVKFYLLTSGGNRTIDLGPVVDRKDRHITMSLLQDVLMLGHTRVGTQALASEKRDLSDVALKTWQNEIAAVFNNDAVPRLLALNGMPLEAAPRIVPGDLRQADLQRFAEAFKALQQAGVDVMAPGDGEVEDINFLRRYLGMPPVDPEAWEEAQALKAEEHAALMEAQAQAQQQARQAPQGDAPPKGTMPDGSQSGAK